MIWIPKVAGMLRERDGKRKYSEELVVSRVAKVLAAIIWVAGALTASAAVTIVVRWSIPGAVIVAVIGLALIACAWVLMDPRSKTMEVNFEYAGKPFRMFSAAAKEAEFESKIDDETKWCDAAFSEISQLTTDYVRSHSKRRSANRNRTVRGIHEFSLGKVEFDEDVLCNPMAYADFGKWKEEQRRLKAVADDLSSIWKSAIGPLRFSESDWNSLFTYDKGDKVAEVAEKFGIPPMMDAYVAGVPVEDIIG